MEWRSLFLPGPVPSPTYAPDVAGPIDPFDERDNIFARMDLRPGTDRYTAYYATHAEFEAADAFFRAMPHLGSTAAPEDRPLMDAIFASILPLARPTEAPALPGNVILSADKSSHLDPSRSAKDPYPSPSPDAGTLKTIARYLGADLVGVGPLNPSYVYSHIGRTYYGQEWGTPIDLPHPHAISLGFGMDYEFLRRHAPGFPVILQSSLLYARAALVAVQLASYIRGLGYSARVHHLRDYQVLCVPVAVDAGLGEMGRAGILITREFGTAVRLSTVTTDMPLEHDSPVDLGIQAFCDKCQLCAMACPSGAIPRGKKIEVRGVRRWKLSAGRCYHYWRTCGSDCALCVVACPWSKPDAETAPLRPHSPEPTLHAETVAATAQLRATLPPWQQKLLGD